jgi:hypothetical protein
MIKNAKVFNFFPATVETEIKQVDLVKGAWQNGLVFDIFLWLLKTVNLFYKPMTGELILWHVHYEE